MDDREGEELRCHGDLALLHWLMRGLAAIVYARSYVSLILRTILLDLGETRGSGGVGLGMADMWWFRGLSQQAKVSIDSSWKFLHLEIIPFLALNLSNLASLRGKGPTVKGPTCIASKLKVLSSRLFVFILRRFEKWGWHSFPPHFHSQQFDLNQFSCDLRLDRISWLNSVPCLPLLIVWVGFKSLSKGKKSVWPLECYCRKDRNGNWPREKTWGSSTAELFIDVKWFEVRDNKVPQTLILVKWFKLQHCTADRFVSLFSLHSFKLKWCKAVSIMRVSTVLAVGLGLWNLPALPVSGEKIYGRGGGRWDSRLAVQHQSEF
jgi:hypothetical protein